MFFALRKRQNMTVQGPTGGWSLFRPADVALGEKRWPKTWTRPLACLALLSMAMTLGCGDGRPQRVPVSGRVLIDGQPLAVGAVRLIPEGARPSVGQLDVEGRFQLTCFEGEDGSVEGRHRVAVVAVEPINDNIRRWHAPKKYANPATSGLTATIQGATDELLIELTWDGGKPFIERTEGE